MKAEFTIDQIRTFVAKGHQSVSTRYVKSALQHLDDISQQSQPSVEEIYNIIEDNVWIHEDGVDEVNAYHEPSDIFRAAQAIHDLYTQGKEPNKCYSCKYEHDDNSHQCNKCDDSYCMWEDRAQLNIIEQDIIDILSHKKLHPDWVKKKAKEIIDKLTKF